MKSPPTAAVRSKLSAAPGPAPVKFRISSVSAASMGPEMIPQKISVVVIATTRENEAMGIFFSSFLCIDLGKDQTVIIGGYAVMVGDRR